MSHSQSTQKQKQFLTNLPYSSRRRRSSVRLRSRGRKRRFLIASLIAFSGFAFQHALPHAHRTPGHAYQPIRGYVLGQATQSGGRTASSLYLPALTAGAVLLMISKARRIISRRRDYSNYLYLNVQDIRGSPSVSV